MHKDKVLSFKQAAETFLVVSCSIIDASPRDLRIMTLILSVCEFLSFWRISVLIQSANDQSFFKQFLISQSNEIIFEVAFLIIFRRPQLSENFSVKLIPPKH